MKYNVTAKLEVYFSREVEIDAESEEEAEAKVIELMGTPDWKYPNVEGHNWEVDPSWGHQDVNPENRSAESCQCYDIEVSLD